MRFSTRPPAVSITVTWLSSSDVTYTNRPSGLVVTPSGSPPTGSVVTTCPLCTSSTLAVPASSLATNSRVPSALSETCSGSDPARITVSTISVARLTTPTPSAVLSGGGSVSSSTPGGATGDPLRATNARRPSGLTLIPRGRFPSGTGGATGGAASSDGRPPPQPQTNRIANPHRNPRRR